MPDTTQLTGSSFVNINSGANGEVTNLMYDVSATAYSNAAVLTNLNTAKNYIIHAGILEGAVSLKDITLYSPILQRLNSKINGTSRCLTIAIAQISGSASIMDIAYSFEIIN